MIYKANVSKEVQIEEFYVLRGIFNTGVCKKVIKEKEFAEKPTMVEIAEFLEGSDVHFASIETNYRIANDFPFA